MTRMQRMTADLLSDPRSSAASASSAFLLDKWPQFASGRLTDVLLDLHAQHGRSIMMLALQFLKETLGDPTSQQFGGSVFDRQQNAIVTREDPFAIPIANPDAARPLFDMDVRIACGQHHAMVQLVRDGFGAMLQGDEIENVLVFVQFALDLNGGAVVVAVQALALVALVADEVP